MPDVYHEPKDALLVTLLSSEMLGNWFILRIRGQRDRRIDCHMERTILE